MAKPLAELAEDVTANSGLQARHGLRGSSQVQVQQRHERRSWQVDQVLPSDTQCMSHWLFGDCLFICVWNVGEDLQITVMGREHVLKKRDNGESELFGKQLKLWSKSG